MNTREIGCLEQGLGGRRGAVWVGRAGVWRDGASGQLGGRPWRPGIKLGDPVGGRGPLPRHQQSCDICMTMLL